MTTITILRAPTDYRVNRRGADMGPAARRFVSPAPDLAIAAAHVATAGDL